MQTQLDENIRTIIREELTKLLPTVTQTSDPDQLLTTEEVAQLTTLSVGYFEIGRSNGNKNLPPYIRVGRRILYRRGDIMSWLEKRRRGTGHA
ncbi:hypothetical protein LP7551_05282 [Roseibium album]|nr:hypothetical protein LP7551_05282 [Roseibium album]